MKKILLAISLVFCLSSAANAEGAWVLWSWVPKSENWSIEAAFPTYKECKERQSQMCDEFSSGGKPVGFQKSKIEHCPDSITIEFQDGSISGIFFKCLPDTIDPRK